MIDRFVHDPGFHLCATFVKRYPTKSITTARVRTCEEESNSRTFQGHSRPCISKFKD